jgi:uncharacterized protein YajQ (UPF0234 family)
MPSFDVVSEVEMHELTNAVDNANREVGTRFDFRGADAKFSQSGTDLTLEAESEFQLKQMMDILVQKLVKRGVDTDCLDRGKVTIRQGIDKDSAKKLVKIIKDAKLKVQAAIQGEQVRVTGKKRDDLQQVIAVLKEQKLGIPLQYINFRD